MTDRESRFLRRTGATGAYLLAAGWVFGGIVLLAGNIILGLDELQTPRLFAFPWEEAPSLHLRLAWTLIMFSYLIFILSDFGIVLAFAAFGMLYAPACRIYRMILVTVVVWMTVALVVDCFLGGAAWVFGLLGEGVDPNQFGRMHKWYDHTVLNIIRFPVRGMYFFMSCALFLFAWLGKQNDWPRGIRIAAIAFGATLMWSVLNFGYNVLFPEHKVQFHTFYTNFFIGAPWFGIRFGRSFRGIESPK